MAAAATSAAGPSEISLASADDEGRRRLPTPTTP